MEGHKVLEIMIIISINNNLKYDSFIQREGLRGPARRQQTLTNPKRVVTLPHVLDARDGLEAGLVVVGYYVDTLHRRGRAGM